jgi:hypothetical protein
MEQVLSTEDRPTHAGEFKTVFDQMAAGTLNDTGTNGPTES